MFEGYLPPVVVRIVGSDRDFKATLAQDKALLLDFARTTTEARIGADPRQFEADIATVRAQLLNMARDLKRLPVGIDAKPFWEEMATLRAEVKAMSPLDINLDVHIAAALAKIAALKAAVEDAHLGSLLDQGLGGDTAAISGGFFSRIFGRLLGGSGGEGSTSGFGNLGSAFFNLLGFHRTRGFLGAFPALGTLGSLLGFGKEHVLATGVGVGGSLLGGAVGGGLLGLGSLGVAGVGMGTDAAGFGQAAGDIKNVVTAMNQLQQAEVVYGKNSYEAAAAQGQLNYALTSFSPKARAAVAAAANTAIGFRNMFDSLTGEAESVAAQIINQVMQVAEKFLPTIGSSALTNMKIFQKDLQPLFSWLDNPAPSGGLGIFKQLENVFTSHLPTAIQAFTNTFEILAKTIAIVAPLTGQFIAKWAEFTSKMNTPAGMAKWGHTVRDLVSLFRTWLHLFTSLVPLVMALFKPAVGLGKTLAEILTQVIQQFTAWLNLSGTQKTMHSLFSAHKGEVKSLLSIFTSLLPVAENVIMDFVRLGTIGAKVFTTIAHGASDVLHLLDQVGEAIGGKHFKVGHLLGGGFAASIAAGITGLVVFNRTVRPLMRSIASLRQGFTTLAGVVRGIPGYFNAAKGVVTSIGGKIGTLASGVKNLAISFAQGVVALGSWVAGMIGVETTSTAVNAALGVGVIGAIVLLGVAIYELVTHWKTVWHTILTVTRDVAHFLESTLSGAWHFIVNGATEAWHLLLGSIKAVWHDIQSAVQKGAHFIESILSKAWHFIVSEVEKHWKLILTIILGVLAPLALAIFEFATHWETIWHAIQHVVSSVVNYISSFLRSAWSTIISHAESAWGTLTSFISSIPGKITSFFSNASTLLYNIGRQIIEGLAHGITDAISHIRSAVSHVANSIVHGFKSFFHIFSPSQVMSDLGHHLVTGVAQGIVSTRLIVEGAVTQLSTFLLNRFTETEKLLLQGWTTTARVIKVIWEDILKEALAVWNRLLAFLKTIPHRIQAIFANASQLLYPIGQQIVQGLMAGISSKQGALMAQVASMAAQIHSTMARAMQVSSPSRVMATLGMWISAGLGQGMERGYNQFVVPQLGMIQAGIRGMAVGGAVGGYGGIGGLNGGLNVTANFEIHAPGGDPQQIMNAIQVDAATAFSRHLLAALRRGGGTIY